MIPFIIHADLSYEPFFKISFPFVYDSPAFRDPFKKHWAIDRPIWSILGKELTAQFSFSKFYCHVRTFGEGFKVWLRS